MKFLTLLLVTKRYWMKQLRQENLIYLAVWGLLFAAPLLSLYVRTVSDESISFDWTEVLLVWRHFSLYLLPCILPLWPRSWQRLRFTSAVTGRKEGGMNRRWNGRDVLSLLSGNRIGLSVTNGHRWQTTESRCQANTLTIAFVRMTRLLSW